MNTSIRFPRRTTRTSLLMALATGATTALLGFTISGGQADSPEPSGRCFSTADAAAAWARAGAPMPLCATAVD
ncbi:hypothetical protein BH09ACT10_BH09ACT10_17880 [soil metagenome]